MNLFSRAFLARHRKKLLFLALWFHISLLDLFYVTYHGPVFLWHDNSRPLTIAVHLGISLSTVLFYFIIEKRRMSSRKKQ